jgi:hypothetical protein
MNRLCFNYNKDRREVTSFKCLELVDGQSLPHFKNRQFRKGTSMPDRCSLLGWLEWRLLGYWVPSLFYFYKNELLGTLIYIVLLNTPPKTSPLSEVNLPLHIHARHSCKYWII